MITIKHLQMKNISALNNPSGVDMQLNFTKYKVMITINHLQMIRISALNNP